MWRAGALGFDNRTPDRHCLDDLHCLDATVFLIYCLDDLHRLDATVFLIHCLDVLHCLDATVFLGHCLDKVHWDLWAVPIWRAGALGFDNQMPDRHCLDDLYCLDTPVLTIYTVWTPQS